MKQDLTVQERLILEQLDLEPIMVKALDKEEGLGWDLTFTLRVAVEYRRYLVLTLRYPETPIVPSNHVDEFWHLHILDTIKYVDDCDIYLGGFLHHFPYFGMRGEQDAQNLYDAWMNTRALYEMLFGPIPEDVWPISNRCPNCGRRCKKGSFEDSRPRLADIGYSVSTQHHLEDSVQ